MKSRGIVRDATGLTCRDLAFGLFGRHPHELDLGGVLEQRAKIKTLVAEQDRPRQSRLVDERHARAFAGVAHDQPEQQGDQQRVDDKSCDQER